MHGRADEPCGCAGAGRFEITLGWIHGVGVAEQTSWYFVAGHCAGIARNFFFIRSSQCIERLVVLKGWFRCANATAGPSPDWQSQGTVLP